MANEKKYPETTDHTVVSIFNIAPCSDLIKGTERDVRPALQLNN